MAAILRLFLPSKRGAAGALVAAAECVWKCRFQKKKKKSLQLHCCKCRNCTRAPIWQEVDLWGMRGADCALTLGSLFGMRGVLMVECVFGGFAYLLGLFRSGGSIAKRRLLVPSRAWTKPCPGGFAHTLHRGMFARDADQCLFGALSIRRHSGLSLVRMPSPSFQRSLRRSATVLHYYGNSDRSSAVIIVQGPPVQVFFF